MARASFLPRSKDGRRRWLNNYAAKLPSVATTVGIPTTEVTSTQADSTFYNYVCDVCDLMAQESGRWNGIKAALNSGGNVGPTPAAPTLPAAPTAVAPDIFGRVSDQVIRIKHHPGYAESIGRQLDIIGTEISGPDLTALKPELTLTMQAGHPLVCWTKQDMDALEIHVDRDGKGFTPLAIDTIPDYLDTAPLPAATAGAVWKYKAVYRQEDAQVGQWSDITSIAVGLS
jgi:hypothetical protein